ncbi:hypothetical protein COY23_02210 [bacterium (Candidatus Torokbacteria) CG_4_10_14_0_2_um_filter_35_8]|nr:MAG: hypothetical protein COY23_02210 [bacterium (Candidatus Torokbacteria) CG_4_10_14_0_2_um_filter_35_8]
MNWILFLHIYQPPYQEEKFLRKATEESYKVVLDILKGHPKSKVTLNISGSLIDLLEDFGYQEVLYGFKELIEKGQVELVGTAKYHPILPLIPEKEVIRQIKLQEKTLEKYFGDSFKRQGFFIPELAYSKKVAKVIKELGYRWIILDEISHSGSIGLISFNKKYLIEGLDLQVIFRNRNLSDLFFTPWLKEEEDFFRVRKWDGRSEKFTVTCCDGENFGHHQKGKEKILIDLLEDRRLKTITCSDYLSLLEDREYVTPIESSWSSRKDELKSSIPYGLWNYPGNPIHEKLWRLQKIALETRDQLDSRAQTLLDKALSSDYFWWAGAMPWWHVDIIEQGAEKLYEVVELSSLDGRAKDQAGLLKEKISKTARDWHASGKAEKIKRAFFKREDFDCYFGGEKVS